MDIRLSAASGIRTSDRLSDAAVEPEFEARFGASSLTEDALVLTDEFSREIIGDWGLVPQLQPGRQWGRSTSSTSSSSSSVVVDDADRDRHGNTKKNKIDMGNGEGEESISRIHMSMS